MFKGSREDEVRFNRAARIAKAQQEFEIEYLHQGRAMVRFERIGPTEFHGELVGILPVPKERLGAVSREAADLGISTKAIPVREWVTK